MSGRGARSAVLRSPAGNDLVAVARRVLSLSDPARPIVLAVSGGSDSTALLAAFADAAGPAAARRLVAATVDHGLREGSRAEADSVAALSARLGVPHHVLSWSGAKPATGLSEAARLARHALLSGLARDFGASVVLVGHTADDQAETIAMRKARNARPDAPGLAGIAAATLFRNQTWFCRPFLAFERGALRGFLASRGLGWIDDPSNEDPARERARVRAEGVTPAVATVDRMALAIGAAALFEKALGQPVPGLWRLDRAALATGEAVLRLSLGTLVALAGGRLHRPGERQMDSILAHAAEGRGLLSAGRCLIEGRAEAIWIYRENRNLPAVSARPWTVWDNRFRLKAGRPAPDERASVPDGVILRAGPGLAPVVAPPEGCRAVPLFSLWRDFLPAFDHPLANCLARIAGLAPPPGLPAAFFTQA